MATGHEKLETITLVGPGGVPMLDPTENVKDRLRDLGAHHLGLREADASALEALRAADLRLFEAEIRRIDELLAMRSMFSDKLEIAEAKRIDAIRAVDVNAVAIANQRATDQAAVLANQVAASAEALRILVASTAATQKTQSDQSFSQLADRISVVERFQYEGRGSAGMVSPVVAEQLAQLQESRYRNEGRSGISAPLLATIVAAAVGLAVFVIQRILMNGG